MPGADPTDKEALAQAVASTYSTAADPTPWELCQQYQQFLEYTAEHPNAGRTRVAANMLDGDDEVPPGRIRVWLNGGMPDAMRGIQACEDHGWLDLAWDGPTLHNLAVLVAWVFSGGSITDHWVPYLAVDDETTAQRVHRLLRALDERPETLRDDDAGRATEVRPTRDAPALGRLLTVLGAPQGAKNRRTELSLPPWLAEAPVDVRLAFARTYVTNRATPREDRPNTPVQIAEQRPQAFRDELKRFLDAVADDDVTRGGDVGKNVRLTAAGADLFMQPPTIRDGDRDREQAENAVDADDGDG